MFVVLINQCHWYNSQKINRSTIQLGAFDEVWPLAKDTNIDHALPNNNMFFKIALSLQFQPMEWIIEWQKANNTPRASRAVPHLSTNRAFRRLTSEFGWDRVHSTKYGRWRKIPTSTTHYQMKCFSKSRSRCSFNRWNESLNDKKPTTP